jgi:uncharacterized membrane protein YkoI
MKTVSMWILIICLQFFLVVSASSAPKTAKAYGSRNQEQTATSQENPPKLMVRSREQAIQLVKRQYQGQVLKADSSRINGHSGYRVKMISKDGLVFYVSVDAQTGSISRN